MKEYIVKVYEDRTCWYNKDGKRHREDGPAVEWSNGYKEYYINGKRHREDGPAVEWANGYKAYYINEQRHNENGPAVEWSNGDKEYYINGVELTKKQFDNRNVKELNVGEIEKLLGYKVKIVK